MVLYSNNVEHLAGWHCLYLPHPAEHLMLSHKQDLVIYDSPFISIACVDWQGKSKRLEGRFWWNTKCVLSVFVLCHSFGLRKANTSSSLAQYITLCKERSGTYCSAFINSHMLMGLSMWICWLQVNLINLCTLLCYHFDNNAPVKYHNYLVKYSDTVCCGSNFNVWAEWNVMQCLLFRCLDMMN